MVECGPIAVIDVGSNSGRLVVYRSDVNGHLELLEDTKASLRLAHDLQRGDGLTEDAMERTVAALKDFLSVRNGAGARRTIVVGTSAMREAANGAELLERIRRETGLAVEIIDGLTEARFSFLGATHSLPVENGYVLDIGGGSLELVHFRARAGIASRTLPLGALRLTTRFLASDPPKSKEIEALRRHVEAVLDEAGVGKAAAGETLVGTGGTVRRLAKIDQQESAYPITQIHGYELGLVDVTRMAEELSALPLAERVMVPGMSSDRADSILGGVFIVEAIMRRFGVKRMLIAGEGLREGIAYDALNAADLSLEAVRRGAVLALARQFATWDEARGERRAQLAAELATALEPGLPEAYGELLWTAAFLLDIGRSIDYYNRYTHTASIVLLAHLGGYSHRELARLSVLIREAEKGKRLGAEVVLIDDEESAVISRLALLLALADEFERHRFDQRENERIVNVGDDTVWLASPPLAQEKVAALGERFQRLYGKRLSLAEPPSRRETVQDEFTVE